MSRLLNDPRFKRFLQAIGKNIHTARLAQDLKIETAATDLKISTNLLHQLENGQYNCDLDALGRICEYYKVDLRDIIPEKNNV